MGAFDMNIGPSLNGLMNQRAMQQAQIYNAGQESQMQQQQDGTNQTPTLRDLLQNQFRQAGRMSMLSDLMTQDPRQVGNYPRTSPSGNPFDMNIGPSLNDMMNQRAMQQAQIYNIGQQIGGQ